MKTFSKITKIAVFSCAAAMIAGCAKANDDGNVKADEATPEVTAVAETVTEEVAADPAPALADDEALAGEVAATPAPTFTDDEVLVEAYGKKLTYGEAISIVSRLLKAQGAPEAQLSMIVEQMAPQALPNITEQFVMNEALKDAAAKAGIVCTEADIADTVSNLTARLPEGETLDSIFLKTGTTREKVMEELKESIPINKLFENLTKSVKADEDAIEKFYNENKAQYFTKPEQVRASHILISVDSTNANAKAEAKAKIDGILAKVKAGEDFAALAKENSSCPSGNEGGDLGFFGKGQMVPEFEAAAFSLPTNQVSDVIETKFGYHIIKVTDKQAGGEAPLAEVKEDIEKFLTQQSGNEIIENYMEGLRKTINYKANDKIKIFAPVEEVASEVIEDAAPAAPAAVESEVVEVPAAAE